MTLADHIVAAVDRGTGIDLAEIRYQLQRRGLVFAESELLDALEDLTNARVLEIRRGNDDVPYFARPRKAVVA